MKLFSGSLLTWETNIVIRNIDVYCFVNITNQLIFRHLYPDLATSISTINFDLNRHNLSSRNYKPITILPEILIFESDTVEVLDNFDVLKEEIDHTIGNLVSDVGKLHRSMSKVDSLAKENKASISTLQDLYLMPA